MKMKLLFVHPTMQIGGAEKSLQTLLGRLDLTQYDADLFLFSPSGELLSLLPPEVHVLPVPPKAQRFLQPMRAAVPSLLRAREFGLLLERLGFSLSVRGNLSERVREQRGWRYMRAAFEPPATEYDAAIAYLEGSPVYYCADLVRAKRKIAVIHSDYRKLEMDAAFDDEYFRAFDSIVAVSDACAETLRRQFPAHAQKVCVVENIIDPDALQRLAQQGASFTDDFDGVRLLTMGRLDAPKGIDIAARAAAKLAGRFDFRWYVLGDGPQKPQLEMMIREMHLEDRFILLGTRANPYPFLRDCDLYVQPSRFEGKSIAIEEAKAFRKPIVTTAYTTVADQITDGVNGAVAAIDENAIVEKIAQLLEDAALRQRYETALQRYTGNGGEIEKFYALLS